MQLGLADAVAVDAGVVGRAEVEHYPGFAPSFEPCMVQGDERLVHLDVGLALAAHEVDLGRERELDP